jgi:hypothetical protein
MVFRLSESLVNIAQIAEKIDVTMAAFQVAATTMFR